MRAILIIILLIATACTTTRYIETPVPIETIKTEYITQIKEDSIYIHDSIDRYISGDTVYQYKYKYIYKFLNTKDTIQQIDTIQIPIEVMQIKEVNKLKWYQSTLMYLGLAFLIVVSYKIIKLWRSIKH